METDLLDAKQKTEFYRDKMQELVREKGSKKRVWVVRLKFRCPALDDYWSVELA